jgi:hypothetical protein
MNASKILIIAALVCFGLATFGVTFSHVALVPLGLALYMTSLLVSKP